MLYRSESGGWAEVKWVVNSWSVKACQQVFKLKIEHKIIGWKFQNLELTGMEEIKDNTY